ncbi:MAG: hypothetical protein AAGF47_09300 [Planctomycetota bacterium]
MQPHPQEPRSSIVGRVLVLVGVLGLLLVIAGSASFLIASLRDELLIIPSSEPVEAQLPRGRPMIVTRRSGLTTAEAVNGAATLPAELAEAFELAVTGPAAFETDQQPGWFEIQSQRHDILGRLTVTGSGPVILTADAGAYPLVVRNDPIPTAVRTLIFTGIGGTLALGVIATGVSFMIQNHNRRVRHRQAVLDGLTD